MTAREWRNHTDERIAALFAAIEQTNRILNEAIIETNRRRNDDWAKTQEGFQELREMQLAANLRMDRLEENLDRVINKVDSWLEGLQPRNGKQ
jgi:hypothetical protein